MKTAWFKQFLLLLTVLPCWGCAEDKPIESNEETSEAVLNLSAESLVFLKTASSRTVSIRTNCVWSVTITSDSDQHWLTVSPDVGNRNATLTVTTATNRTGASRKASITLSLLNGDTSLSKTISVVQLSTDTEASTHYTLPFKVGTFTVPVNGTLGTRYTVESDDAWVECVQEESDETQAVLRIADNEEDLPRETTLALTSEEGIRQTVHIFQYGKPNPRIGDDLTAAPLAFPGAEGGGRFTTGGRGGTVYHVTNLLDYDKGETPIEGSLRYGLDMDGAKTIVFDVAGYIDLKRAMQIVKPDFSIIGQTAPGDGITLRNYELSVRYGVNNALIRFIRVRPGEQSGEENDAISGRWFKQGIVDHVSGSWSIDECITFYGVQDFTLQWSIAAESLNNSVHGKGAHGYGAMFSGDNASCHHFLIMHHSNRTPRISALSENLQADNELDNQGYSDLRNLVVYNWNRAGMGAYGGENNPFNWVNNYMKAGPATGTGYKAWRLMQGSKSSRIYADGNYATANPLTAEDNWTYGIWDQVNFTAEEKAAMKVDTPHPFAPVTTHSATLAFEKVAQYAGASLHRDAIDRRLAAELTAGTATYNGSVSGLAGIIDRTSDAGGYPEPDAGTPIVDTDRDGIPDLWEDAYGLDKHNAEDAALYTLDAMGRYSNLEVYFHNLVQHIVYQQNLGGTVLSQP